MNILYLYKEEAASAAYNCAWNAGAIIGRERLAKVDAFDNCVNAEHMLSRDIYGRKWRAIPVTSLDGVTRMFAYVRPAVTTLGGLARMMTDLRIAVDENSDIVREACVRNGWSYLRDVKIPGTKIGKCLVAYDPVNKETLRYHGDLGFVIELGAPKLEKDPEKGPRHISAALKRILKDEEF